MTNGEKARIPIRKKLWEPSGEGEVRLIGSSCLSCGEIFFPVQDSGICTHCQGNRLEEIKLSPGGVITSFSVVYQKPAGGFYSGPVPYAYGFVKLPEGVKVETLFTGCNLEELEVGMEVCLVIDKLCENGEGAEILTYKFKPVKTKDDCPINVHTGGQNNETN